MAFDDGVVIPQGAENSAVKYTAPLSLTPLRICENASIPLSWPVCKVSWPLCKAIGAAGRSSNSCRRPSMVMPAEAPHNCRPEGVFFAGMATGSPEKGDSDESESSVMGKGRLHGNRRVPAPVGRGSGGFHCGKA